MKVFIEKIIAFKILHMKKKDFKRISIWADPVLYLQIKEQADKSYLRIATYTRQLIQQALKNNYIKN
jgi:hypothetical protein